MPTFLISDVQAKEFARTIFADIDNFVREHQEEYDAFLKAEESDKQTKSA